MDGGYFLGGSSILVYLLLYNKSYKHYWQNRDLFAYGFESQRSGLSQACKFWKSFLGHSIEYTHPVAKIGLNYWKQLLVRWLVGCQAEILCATLNGLHYGRGSVTLSHLEPMTRQIIFKIFFYCLLVFMIWIWNIPCRFIVLNIGSSVGSAVLGGHVTFRRWGLIGGS